MAVSPSELYDIASKYETSMARAMIAALASIGVTSGARPRHDSRYDGMRACFANYGSPMDLIR